MIFRNYQKIGPDIMQVPEEFQEFAAQFYQDILDDAASEGELIDWVLSLLKDGLKRVNLRKFLDAIMQDSMSNEELRKLWWSTSADIVFYDGAALKAFLMRVRDSL